MGGKQVDPLRKVAAQLYKNFGNSSSMGPLLSYLLLNLSCGRRASRPVAADSSNDVLADGESNVVHMNCDTSDACPRHFKKGLELERMPV